MACLQTVTQIVVDVFTGKDGQSADFGRVFGAAIIVAFLIISCYVYIVLKQPFDPIGWGTGGGGLFTGIGAHLKLKSSTEPDA